MAQKLQVSGQPTWGRDAQRMASLLGESERLDARAIEGREQHLDRSIDGTLDEGVPVRTGGVLTKGERGFGGWRKMLTERRCVW